MSGQIRWPRSLLPEPARPQAIDQRRTGTVQSGLVTAADTDLAPSTAPSPEECPHPAPVRGVMAHEFAHYQGALGPEGIRRTVTFYGPVIGGLPIDAWHCEVCGLLRLSFPDGRKEERRLYPGPQPGLLATPSVVDWGRELRGEQPIVSGLSISERIYERLYAAEVGAPRPAWRLQLPGVSIPQLDFLGWANVAGLVAILVGLLVAALVAVVPESLQPEEGPIALSLGLIFSALVVINVASPLWRRIFPMPRLRPSVAETAGGKPALDAADRTAVILLVISLLGLIAAAVLAVYWYSTPGATAPVFILSIAAAVGAAMVEICAAAVRAVRR